MNEEKPILLSPPHLNGSEAGFVREAFDTNWIALLGPNVDRFEAEVSDYLGCRYALALSSGTASIHMALKYLGAAQGDCVFCSDVTFSGSCNPILYEKAEPVFIDSEPGSWNMSPGALARALADFSARGRLPKAVVVVDLYGMPARYDQILPLCRQYGVPVVEDAAEALGSRYRGEKCGTLGDIGVLSFNGNKILTCSGGGMVLTDLPGATDKMKFWANQSKEPSVLYYEHRELGYNYRMSNILAGIGRGQLKSLPEYVNRRRAIHQRYKTALAGYPVSFAEEFDGAFSNFWLTVLLLDKRARVAPPDVVRALNAERIEARNFWNPMHMQPLFSPFTFYPDDPAAVPVGERLFAQGVCLPSGTGMTDGDVDRVAACIRNLFRS
ncbi:MAG TPA: DegT/DnrJ/EryC1/StrS family aminotransferase [Feifaniaceae bacterium]|nr:DegT/DnrJ/EryC1/StrS family aminotransferase [Feifaniaceae bacterium]